MREGSKVVGRWGVKEVEVTAMALAIENLKSLERVYSHLVDVPKPVYVTHGTDPGHLVDILRGKIITKAPDCAVHFSLNTCRWGECSIFFPWENIRHALKPVFYVPLLGFTIPMEDFGHCCWDCITFTEVYSWVDIPLTWATAIVVSKPIEPSIERDVRRLVDEIGLAVWKGKPKTRLASWAEEARKFCREAMAKADERGTHWWELTEKYTPKFVRSYNKMLEELFGIPEERVLRELEIMMGSV